MIVIVADDLGYADMSFLPQAPEDVKKFKTPGFDRLAETGIYFQNAYGTSPICSPSREGLITGRYQQRWGSYWYGQGGLPKSEQTLPEVLSSAGYATAKFGKTHFNGGPKVFPTLHGFDHYLGFVHHTWDYIRLSQKDVDAYESREKFKSFGNAQVLGPLLSATGQGTPRDKAEKVSYEDGFTTEIFTTEAVNYIKEKKDDKPFYLHVSHNAVHMPTYVVEKTWAERVGTPYTPWDRDAESWEFPYWEPNQEPATQFHKKWGHLGKINKEGRRTYLANLLALDESITRILDALEETGQRDNTLVVFCSDNGGTVNTYSDNTPLRGSKYMFGEGGIRIPMLVSMPSAFPQAEVNEEAIVSTMDIFPTVMDLIGQEVPDNLDGKSLLPVIRGEQENHHDHIVWAQHEDTWVIRQGDWKLTHNAGWKHANFKILENGDAVHNPEEMTYPEGLNLFNLKDDIGETKNVAKEHPEVVEKMRKLQKKWYAEMKPMKSKGKAKGGKKEKQKKGK